MPEAGTESPAILAGEIDLTLLCLAARLDGRSCHAPLSGVCASAYTGTGTLIASSP